MFFFLSCGSSIPCDFATNIYIQRMKEITFQILLMTKTKTNTSFDTTSKTSNISFEMYMPAINSKMTFQGKSILFS